MASASTVQRDSLTSSQVPEYFNFLSKMTPHIPTDLRNYAEELCKYFETHGIDPYGCVLSQRPTRAVKYFMIKKKKCKLTFFPK